MHSNLALHTKSSPQVTPVLEESPQPAAGSRYSEPLGRGIYGHELRKKLILSWASEKYGAGQAITQEVEAINYPYPFIQNFMPEWHPRPRACYQPGFAVSLDPTLYNRIAS